MMKENYNTPNSGCCGRPFPTAPENKCNYNDCCMNEYTYKQKACIRNKQPDCESQAVIPSITVETVDGISNLANCLVHVMENNTTYYVDDKHRILITWAGPVNIPGYDMEGNPNNYKNQIVTDVEAETAVIYDNHGKGFIFGITPESLQQAVNDKLDEMAADGTLGNLIAEYIKDAVLSFDTVADMKNSTDLQVGYRVRTLGFHTLNDRGGAYYKITDAGTANEMDVIAVGTGLYANLIVPTILAPEMVGATGDGTTNDTASFNRALQIADKIEGNGTYLIDNITISEKEIKCHLKTAQINGISFENNVTFIGQLTTTIAGNVDSGARGVRVLGDNVTIKDTVFDGVAVGIAVEIHTGTYNTNIQNCHFMPNFSYDVWCGGGNVTIENCLFDEHTPTSPTPSSAYGCGIKVSQTPDDFAEISTPNNIIIKNNVIYGHGDNDIDFFTGASNVILDSNILHNPSHLCVEIKVTSDTTTYPNQHNYDFVISNNIMNGARNLALRNLTNTSNFNRFIVANNQFYTNTASCLVIENIFDAQFTGNQFRSSYASGGSDIYAINVNNTTSDIMKLFISDCTFDNFVTVITEAASFANTVVHFDNIKAYNLTKFVRARATDVIYLNNSDIVCSANCFNSQEGKVFVSNSSITCVDAFAVGSANAVISAVNCTFNASGYVFRRGNASFLYKYALIACDYSGSANLCIPAGSVADSVPFTQLT